MPSSPDWRKRRTLVGGVNGGVAGVNTMVDSKDVDDEGFAVFVRSVILVVWVDRRRWISIVGSGRDLPGNEPVPVLERAGRPVRRQGRQVDDGVSAFGDGLRAAVVVEVGAGEAGVGRVD